MSTTFIDNLSKGDGIIQHLPDFLEIARTRLLLHGTAQKFTHEIHIIKNNTICVYLARYGAILCCCSYNLYDRYTSD